jgi:hypothetical protein
MPFLYMTTHILKGLEVMLRDLALLLKCQLDIKLIKLCFLFVLRGAHAWHSLHCLIRPWERVVDSQNYSNQPTAQELHTISVYHRIVYWGLRQRRDVTKACFEIEFPLLLRRKNTLNLITAAGWEALSTSACPSDSLPQSLTRLFPRSVPNHLVPQSIRTLLEETMSRALDALYQHIRHVVFILLGTCLIPRS